MAIDRTISQPLYLVDTFKHSKKRRGYSETFIRRRDKAIANAYMEARKTVISMDFWDRFILLAKVCYMRDKEADIYDVFETYRVNFMGGWESSPEQLSKIDAILEKEELGYGLAGV